MSAAQDRFSEWDAAYVLGALSTEERREYEEHLAGCPACRSAVAELAGVPGLLAKIDGEAVAMGATPLSASDAPFRRADTPALPADTLPRLVAAVRSRRRRVRLVVSGSLVAVSAATAALALVLPMALGVGGAPGAPRAAGPSVSASPTPAATPAQTAPGTPPPDEGASERIQLAQVTPSALTADVAIAAETWGTRVETRCRYARSDSRPGHGTDPQPYALYVTDRAGRASVVATWLAAPGGDVSAVGTTSLAPGDIVRVDIRSVGTGEVLLAADPPR